MGDTANENVKGGAQADGHGRAVTMRLGRLVFPNRLPEPVNPALLKLTQERAEAAQNRIADRITAFAGSMAFVYIHVLWFGCWIALGVDCHRVQIENDRRPPADRGRAPVVRLEVDGNPRPAFEVSRGAVCEHGLLEICE